MNNPDERLKQKEISITHILEYYKNHCEFLGYTIEEDTEFSIICRHQRKDRFRLVLLNHGVGVMAQIYYFFPENLRCDLTSLYSYANELNYILTFMKACIRRSDEENPFIMLTSVLEGEYSRKNFAIFLDNIQQDMTQFHSYPKTVDIWQDQDD